MDRLTEDQWASESGLENLSSLSGSIKPFLLTGQFIGDERVSSINPQRSRRSSSEAHQARLMGFSNLDSIKLWWRRQRSDSSVCTQSEEADSGSHTLSRPGRGSALWALSAAKLNQSVHRISSFSLSNTITASVCNVSRFCRFRRTQNRWRHQRRQRESEGGRVRTELKTQDNNLQNSRFYVTLNASFLSLFSTKHTSTFSTTCSTNPSLLSPECPRIQRSSLAERHDGVRASHGASCRQPQSCTWRPGRSRTSSSSVTTESWTDCTHTGTDTLQSGPGQHTHTHTHTHTQTNSGCIWATLSFLHHSSDATNTHCSTKRGSECSWERVRHGSVCSDDGASITRGQVRTDGLSHLLCSPSSYSCILLWFRRLR